MRADDTLWPTGGLAGRTYVTKRYPIEAERGAAVDVLHRAVEASGGRLVHSSYHEHRVAPVHLGVEDGQGSRYGVLVYPFTATRRDTRNRPPGEHRVQIRYGDPARARDESNHIAFDPAGVDVTVVLAVDPERGFLVGLDPLVYEDLPMGISLYYRDRHVALADALEGGGGWAVWERQKSGGTRRRSWEGLETLVGFRPHRFLDYVRFEAKASALGLDPGLRRALAEELGPRPGHGPHRLEAFFAVPSATILDIISANFRLGVAVRGGVAEHHLAAALATDPAVATVEPVDADGPPDLLVTLHDGRSIRVECKTAGKDRYKVDGSFKAEIQKTRDSAAGRKYTFDQFDVVAVCLFPATGQWDFRFRWAADLTPWAGDPARIQAIQRVDGSWAPSLSALLSR